ncbi:hypothetical protein OQ484_00030 [Pseudomonas aeruginosa]|uniref:hypothetical protein n=1 Tax=Pseudomonas aeruginosa TaxID=287 RepID=UPI002245F81A|nr:hypothetical protein [Pseudomonas aeruginosa]MCX2515790.1 hypothetical protein [Pseudomonas aeruginosa]
MSLETQIAALVNAANTLTNAVNGKMGDIDNKVLQTAAKFDEQVGRLKSQLPRIAVTKNFVMADPSNLGRPDAFGYHEEISWSKVRTILQVSPAAGRPQADIDLLAEIERDVKEVYPDFDIWKYEYYRQNFTVWQAQWTGMVNGPAYLLFPTASDSASTGGVASVPLNSYLTIGAFVKVIDGSIAHSWSSGAQKGKWRWCSSILEPSTYFGGYTHLHPMRETAKGVVQIALVGACTGVVDNPAHWGAMMSLG